MVVENRPGGDAIVSINAFLGANDDHTFWFGPTGSFIVHPFVYTKLNYNPADLIPIARVSNTILAVSVKKDAPYSNIKEFTGAARAAPGTFNSGLVQGVTEFTFWGYQHHEKLQITQVPYRDIKWRRSISAKAASRWSCRRSRWCSRSGRPAASS